MIAELASGGYPCGQQLTQRAYGQIFRTAAMPTCCAAYGAPKSCGCGHMITGKQVNPTAIEA